MLPVPCIVLAAGGSSRHPGGKLLTLYRGYPLLRWTLQRVTAHPFSRILVVTGHRADEVEALLPDEPSVLAVANPDWQSGIASSLQAGLRACEAAAPGAVICLGDTPFFSAATLQAVHPSTIEEAGEVRVPVYEGQDGHPKYIPRRLFGDLIELSGDQGAGPVLRRQPAVRLEVDDPGVLLDFDTPDDFLEEGGRGTGEPIMWTANRASMDGK